MLGAARFGGLGRHAAAAAAVDPYFADVILLLKGENGTSSTILDSSSLNLSHGTNNGTTNSTTYKKFDNGSVYQTGLNNLIEYASNSRWEFNTGNWTFECWIMLPNGFDGYGVAQITHGGSNRAGFYFDNTNMSVYTGAGSYSAPHGGITTGVWYHMAWTKVSGVNKPRMYVNGVEKTVSGTASWSSGTGQSYRIGRLDGGTHSTKYIDELRITKSANSTSVRYNGNFTPPTEPFPTQGPA